MVVTATRPEDLLELLCDQVAVQREGRLVWSGDPAEAEKLAAPEHQAGLRVRADILDGLEAGLALLRQRHDVSELELDEDGHNVWFFFTGERDALPGLLPQLVRAGCILAHFGVERRSPAAAIANLFRTET
jgi:ABC-type multidrug transport system ATPase subunit